MTRASKASHPGTFTPGDAVGRLVITLSLTACMGGVAVAASIHSALAPLATAGGVANVAPPSPFFSDQIGQLATAALQDEAPAATGMILPLPPLDASAMAGVDAPGSSTDWPAIDRASTGMLTALEAREATPVIDHDQRLESREATGWDTADWLTTADPTPVLQAERVVVQDGDTLLQILLRSGIDRAEAHEVVGTLATLYDPRRLRVGQAMAVEVERAGDALAAPRLAALSLNLDFGNDLRIERDANGDFNARKVDRELIETVHAAHAVIDNSLYETARRHSVPDEALVNLANIFSWDIDFQRDVHPGDRFELVYETVESPDGEVRGGQVLFASLHLRGQHVHAYRYEHDDGTAGYYDSDGSSLRKWLMRTPIDGARLSSGFGPRRHPILGYNRMHRGVDFAAPTGTPIFAAGDGEITKIGRNGAYGNYIQIRHNNEFSTAYAHMSRFAEGLKDGSRVRQGQVIAYVGSTGRSTGPHLHYEVLQNGEQINPLSIKPQTGARLVGADLERFRRQIETIDAKRPTLGVGTAFAQR